MRPFAELEFPVSLDPAGDLPLHRQLADQLRDAVHSGELRPGQRLPSSRTLAARLGVSRTVTLTAYAELSGEGYLDGQHGSGTYVSPDLRAPLAGSRTPSAGRATADPARHRAVIDLRPGCADTSALAGPDWRRAWRAAADHPPPTDPGPAEGLPELRREIAAHLQRFRGLQCTAHDVLVTTGTRDSLELLTAVRGDHRVGIEDPGYPAAHRIFGALGAHVESLPVDDAGLITEQLPTTDPVPTVIYVTPAHQYPLGGRLPASRRLDLLRWARTHDALVIEDDYDSEFRFDVPPLPALAALDRDQVTYLGTLSKVLSPSLRVGYLLAPPQLHHRLVTHREADGYRVPHIVQTALAGYFADGAVARHIARMRRTYAAKRHLLIELLEPTPLTLRGLDAGLHGVLALPPEADEHDVVDRLAEAGILLAGLGEYHHKAERHDRGLVLGYGAATPADLHHAVAALTEVLSAESASHTR
ncbi:MAG: PLP-dependent aminotransferase family protein [Actinomycetota bacterium]|nr:PLP-dependent aminotransferase family protein [Actinomycetota bacterium]